ncbi:translation initiation factor IF-3 [Filifactor alocis ATCC 35896]|jgi:translation initiation factor IF-3|uniref:Translation initiation factor IF-3 n=1 Tax=Filifactor alocis (strain ATCC 35896 / CCUG 47790 / D40 B5) TaxID=546269 RepID=D6GPX8_FILAD|nr:translation initiation factor IF-3 [Filifactor alocis]EFE28831.1 translation initiation factor IF-3 [Filifactor alocis ATCC 35896]
MLFALFLCRKQSESFDKFWRCIIIKEQQINEEIRDKEIRLIGESGEQLGIMSAKQALELATAQELDLVKISPNAVPPVCKIMDYGKYKYESAKREKESKKKQKVVVMKELRLRPAIEENDLKTKAKMGTKFLANGDKLKVSVRFRGRELGHKDIGFIVLDKFVELVQEQGTPVGKPKMEGNSLVLMVEPTAKK